MSYVKLCGDKHEVILGSDGEAKFPNGADQCDGCGTDLLFGAHGALGSGCKVWAGTALKCHECGALHDLYCGCCDRKLRENCGCSNKDVGLGERCDRCGKRDERRRMGFLG